MNIVIIIATTILSVQGVWVDQGGDNESPLQLLRQGKLSMGPHTPIFSSQ